MSATFGTSSREKMTLTEPPENTSAPAVYVVRLPEPSRGFAWEIRKFGAIVLERSREDFPTPELARADGQAALAAFLAV